MLFSMLFLNSIVIPLEQGLRLFPTEFNISSAYSIVIPLEQGLRHGDILSFELLRK